MIHMSNRTRHGILSIRILLLILAALFIVQTPVFFLSTTASSTVNYPLALHFSVKLDVATNQWFINVTNMGKESLFVIFSLSPATSNWATENHTTLSPGANFMMATRCVDPTDHVLCKLTKSEQYTLVFDAYTSLSRDSLSFASHISANDRVYVFSTYPMIALNLATTVNSQKWNIFVSNAGTKEGTFQAFLSYTGSKYQNEYQLQTAFHGLGPGKSFQVVGMPLTPKSYDGAGAVVDAYGHYSGVSEGSNWSAVLDVEHLVTVK